MAYLNNIPTAPQRLKDSQPQILANFQAIQTLVDVNHVTFDDPSGDQGKHKWVTFPVQAAAPVFVATEDGLYNKVPAAPFPLTGIQELFIHKQSFAGDKEVPMTASILSTATPATITDGWTYLPSGLIMQWQNNVAAAAVMNDPHNFPMAFPNACLTVQVCVAAGGTPSVGIGVGTTPATNTTFYTRTGNATTFNYFAIGY